LYDEAVITTMKWTEWKIPPSSLTDVNLGKIKKLYIGAGDRNNPTKDGTGLVYIDDICLAKP
jgi:hypothetical protein